MQSKIPTRIKTLKLLKTRVAGAAGALLLSHSSPAQDSVLPPLQPAGPSSLSPATGEPPRDTPLVEKQWSQLSNTSVSDDGEKALKLKPDKWKHAETDNFLIHYRRVTEAKKVAREIEYNLWFVAKALGATPEQYRRKTHVFIFADETEWLAFLQTTNAPLWAVSYAHMGELFLNVRDSDMGIPYDSHTLAHETTHAVVSRLYPFEHWPVWLSEGFAEFMGRASVASRNHQSIKSNQGELKNAEMPLDEMFALKKYPEEQEKVGQLYATGEKFVRYLMNELPKERFRKYVSEVLSTNDPEKAFMTVYGDKFKDFDAFKKKFEQFSK